nr:hypothetical protein [Tanacetum cinerariifolium]
SKSTTTKSAWKWKNPTLNKTSLAILIGLETERSASSSVMHVGILVLILDVLALVLRTLTLALHIPQDCIVSFDIAFEVSLRHSLCLRNRGLVNRSLIYLRSIKLALIERRWVEVRLVEISSSVLIKIVSPIEIVLVILMGRKTGRSDLFDSTALTGAGVVDRVGAGDWFFLSKSNALTMSLSSATSDEMTRVDELVPTLATTALAPD